MFQRKKGFLFYNSLWALEGGGWRWRLFTVTSMRKPSSVQLELKVSEVYPTIQNSEYNVILMLIIYFSRLPRNNQRRLIYRSFSWVCRRHHEANSPIYRRLPSIRHVANYAFRSSTARLPLFVSLLRLIMLFWFLESCLLSIPFGFLQSSGSDTLVHAFVLIYHKWPSNS